MTGLARSAWRALPFALVVGGVAAFDLRFHEFWRDEACAMLAARAVPWAMLLEHMRYEGTPPLFHAVLKVAAAVLPAPAAMVAVGALGLSVLLLGTARLLEAVSGDRRAAARATLALSFTYVYAYELGVMIRQYTLGLGLALLSFAHLRRALSGDRRALRAGVLFGALATLISAHSACLAGAGFLAFGLLSLARRRPLRVWWPVVLPLPCFALVLHLASPLPDRIARGNVYLEFPPEITFRLSMQAMVEGFMPLDWWLAESFLPRPFPDVAAALRSVSFWGVLTGAAVALAGRAARIRKRWRVEAFDVLAIVASWPALLDVILHHYWGSFRHHLFLGIPLLVLVVGWALDRRGGALFAVASRRATIALLAPWLAFQIALGAACFVLDHRYAFSDTKGAASVLAPDARVVAEQEWRSMGMLLWRPDIRMRATAWGGRPFRYWRPEVRWEQRVPVGPLVAEECRAATARVYFAGFKGGLGPLAACARRIDYPASPLWDHPFTFEKFELLELDCACVGERSPAP
jgi:hypothetical protein